MTAHYHLQRIVSSLDKDTRKATTHMDDIVQSRFPSATDSGVFARRSTSHVARYYKGEVTRIGVASYLVTADTLMISYTTVPCTDEPCEIGRRP